MSDYASACFPATVRVFGCTLRPLTLGHALVLQLVRSPFAPGVERTREPGIGDVLLGVWICSQPWQRAARRMGSVWARLWLRWMVCVLALCRVQLWYRNLLWMTYLAEANCGPDTWRLAGAKTSSSIPPILSVKMTLMQHWGKSEQQAMDTPLAQAIWEQTARLVTTGEARLVTDEERAIMTD